MQKKVFILPVLLVVTSIFAYSMGANVPTTSVSTDGGVKHVGRPCYEIYRVDGTVEKFCSDNIIVDSGRIMLQEWAIHDIGAAIDYLAVGGNTSSALCTGEPKEFCGAVNNSWTNITNHFNAASGLEADQCTLKNATDPVSQAGNTSCTITYTATADNLYVNLSSLSNGTLIGDTPTGVPFVIAGFTNAILQTNDQLNVTWYWWIA